jgi:type IV pilus assembly protein PilC
MPNYAYVALDAHGHETRGALSVDSQSEALRRIKEMGFFPTKVIQETQRLARGRSARSSGPETKVRGLLQMRLALPGYQPRPKHRTLITFTRQMATLLEAGMPLLRGLRLIREQEADAGLQRIIANLESSIEGGASFSEALTAHPKAFNRLYVQMVKAGELSGAVDVVLTRLAGFMEKAQRIKNKVMAAMFYPAAVVTVAIVVLGVLLVFVVPRFEEIFQGLLNGRPMPDFTRFVLDLSTAVKNHIFLLLGLALGTILPLKLLAGTRPGHHLTDRIKLNFPILGQIIRKAVVARFTRTLGTLVSNGVPILPALNIVKETTGNTIVSDAVADVYTSVQEGETITAPMRASGVFPAVVIGMVDIGEQTGALPEMLLKIADNYDDEVDNAVAAMTSLLEPIMIIFLAIIVGSIVIALFLPLVDVAMNADGPQVEPE